MYVITLHRPLTTLQRKSHPIKLHTLQVFFPYKEAQNRPNPHDNTVTKPTAGMRQAIAQAEGNGRGEP
jgi:hypothetical protein